MESEMKSKCLICGKEIDKTVPWKKYCSGTCKQIAWAEKKKKELKRLVKGV